MSQKDNEKNEREFEKLFRRWKRSVERSGVLQELKNREFFEKPSVKRHRIKQTLARSRRIEAENVVPRRRRRYGGEG